MAMTTLLVRLFQTGHATTVQSTTVKSLLVGLFLLVGTFLTGCGSGDGSPEFATASKSLAWDPVAGAHGYVVYYGTESPGVFGSCAYGQSVLTDAPSVTVGGLTPNTAYFFAVTAYNGLESACSDEVTAVTDPVTL